MQLPRISKNLGGLVVTIITAVVGLADILIPHYIPDSTLSTALVTFVGTVTNAFVVYIINAEIPAQRYTVAKK